MKKKTVTGLPVQQWDPKFKEPWLIEFEKAPVNDERWSCLVTAAIQAEAQYEEYIQIFNQCAATGLRKAIKTITMADVVKFLKGSNSIGQGKKKEGKKFEKSKQEKVQNTGIGKTTGPKNDSGKLSPPMDSQIIDLALTYAIFNETECKLPPDLMAVVLKYLILMLKGENCTLKKAEAAKKRKARRDKIRERFIRNLKPYKANTEEFKFEEVERPKNLLRVLDTIEDEPYGGPDLYIMLSDFYDSFYFPELQRINVPFVAILKISTKSRDIGKWSYISMRTEYVSKKGPIITNFWQNVNENCLTSEKTAMFKNIAFMQYKGPLLKNLDRKQDFHRIIFDELSWMQYSVYRIYKQHQLYLREMFVQRVVLSLEPLDLTQCGVYNKLCDCLVTGESNTPLLVLYALVEQVVAGVPHTESVPLEYEPIFHDFFLDNVESESTGDAKSIKTKDYVLVTPCEQCREKKDTSTNVCNEKWENSLYEELSSEKGEWCDETEEKLRDIYTYQVDEISQTSSCNKSKSTKEAISNEYIISERLVTQVLTEKKTEKELERIKKWVSPKICFHADSVSLQTYYCDPRLLDPSTVVERFLKNSDLPKLWSKYPNLAPEERAFYNYHFYNLWKISEENKESLKLKIFFALSMKLIGITKSYLYRGEEENTSEMLAGTPKEAVIAVRFDQKVFVPSNQKNGKNFSDYFFKTFIANNNLQTLGGTTIKLEAMEKTKGSLIKTDSHLLRKVTSQFNMYLVKQRSSGACFPYCFFPLDSNANNSQVSFAQTDKEFAMLSSLLDCFEISTIIEPQSTLHDKNDFVNLIQKFNFFEKLEPNCMIQRLLEAQENYNTTQCSYFPPTDSLILIMHNDFDYRGIFYTCGIGTLQTPVVFRDFYNYLYPEISEWLIEVEADHENFLTELQEKAKEEEEIKDRQFLEKLKKQFCSMGKEEREKFLSLSQREKDEVQSDIENLPVKPRPSYFNKVSFVTTNLADIRVESQRNIHEYHSRDGSEVVVILDSWLYEPVSLLSLMIKQLKMKLTFYQKLGVVDTKKSFFLKTNSDIIFSFHNDKLEMQPKIKAEFNYFLKISWPTGLTIEGVPQKEKNIYIKQGYLKPYREKKNIENEKFRCYTKNGQVVIFKKNGVIDVLCASGEKHSLQEIEKSEVPVEGDQTSPSVWIPWYESTTTSGEVWQKSNLKHCKNKRKLISTLKVYLGVDNKTQEIFYTREDGVTCMLWPCGKLVTMYPEGTKITSVPDFDGEVITEWSGDEEKLYNVEYESKQKFKRKFDSKSDNKNLFEDDGFVLITCSYLMEHPKYSSVCFNPKASFATVKMVEGFEIKMYPEGNYEVKQDRTKLKVQDSIVEFSRSCCACGDQTTATLFLESSEILCKFVDFFRKVFLVLKNGETTLHDNSKDEENSSDECETKERGKTCSTRTKCPNHIKSISENQRCFAFERDMSGVEFIHADSLANHCYHLPSDTHFDLDRKSNENIRNHTFASPCYRVGYENWVMEYEDNYDHLPKNLKKKDLQEFVVRGNFRKPFKYSFPQSHEFNNTNLQNHYCSQERQSLLMPKIIIIRTVKCFPKQPKSVIDELQKYVAVYQKRAREICNDYKNYKNVGESNQDSRYIKMRLRKIALTLNQNLKMYPHLCTQNPSTEKEIHFFGHFINSMDYLTSHIQDDGSDCLPDCKQIPKKLPRSSDFECIKEENEPPQISLT